MNSSIAMSKVYTSSSTGVPKFYLVVWTLFLLMIPFYFMGKTPVLKTSTSINTQLSTKVESGVPQVSDYTMMVLMALVFTGIGFCVVPQAQPIIRAFGYFACYVTFINLVWSFLLQELSPLYNTLFYLYNFVLLVTFLVLYSSFREKLLRLTLYTVMASVFLQVALSPLAIDRTQFRQALFFNNPNQLGYFAVLAPTLFFLGTRRFPIKTAYQVCFYAGIAYLAVLSLSKATLIALALFIIPVILHRPRFLLVAGGCLIALVATAYLASDKAPMLLERLEKRLLTREYDETPEARGYDRMFKHAEYNFFGAGEGAYPRFKSVWPGELHSGWATLLFCYGVVGTVLFGRAVFLICRRVDHKSLLLLVPVIFYGFVHQNLRSTLFWVLLAFLFCLTISLGPGDFQDGQRGRDQRQWA